MNLEALLERNKQNGRYSITLTWQPVYMRGAQRTACRSQTVYNVQENDDGTITGKVTADRDDIVSLCPAVFDPEKGGRGIWVADHLQSQIKESENDSKTAH